ncbi:MAG: acyl carrier protein [Candidatus Adiutrix sp.]|jgi:acyl carrier protein|nr:acyl carrier protein [Candidatus Adiutrix sp.]
MDGADFLTELQDLLQRDEALTPDMPLRDLPEWDSMSMMAVAGFFDQRFGLTLNFGDFESCVTVEDLMRKAGLGRP